MCPNYSYEERVEKHRLEQDEADELEQQETQNKPTHMIVPTLMTICWSMAFLKMQRNGSCKTWKHDGT